MRKSIIGGMLAGLLGIHGVSHAAAIYQCEEKGRKVFSQQPCGTDAKVVKPTGERTVAMSVNMPNSDIGYLCSLAMRSWERVKDEQRNSRATNAYGYYAYGSNGNSEESRRAFVLSHIDNLESVAVDDPELYDIAKSISTRTFYGSSNSYTYDAERARAEKSCFDDMRSAIDRVKERYKYEDERRYGKK